MKINFKKLIVCILIPLAVGALSALLSGGGMADFGSVTKPPLSPPGWLFPIVWTILYSLMGIASYLVSEAYAPADEKQNAFELYAAQLILNFFWSIIFFRFDLYFVAFVWLLALLALIILTTISFYRISKTAGILMIPYILWVTFAGYLTLGIAILN